MLEARDLEDLAHHRLQCGGSDPLAARAHLPRRHHQHAQADAADVLDRGEVEHERAVARRLRERRQRLLQAVGAGVIDAASGHCDDDIVETADRNVQGVLRRRGP